jgi:hypothetical protein
VFGGHFPCPSPVSSTYDGRNQNLDNTLEHCNQIYLLRHDFVHAALCGDAPDMTHTWCIALNAIPDTSRRALESNLVPRAFESVS